MGSWENRFRSRFDAQRFRVAANLAGRFGAKPGFSWVDIGCHNGSFARYLSTAGGFEVTGIDVWDPVHMADSTWTYIQHDVEKPIPLTDGSAQVVSALEVIEHIVDTDRFLDEVRRILLPRGLFILSTPNINMLRNRARVLFGAYPYGLEWKTVVRHVRVYNVRKLKEHLAEHGFEGLYVRGLNLLPMRFLGTRFFDRLSECMAIALPTLCSTTVAVFGSVSADNGSWRGRRTQANY